MTRREFTKPVKRCSPGLPLAERHTHYTDKSGGPDACWPWLGALNAKGYGVFGTKKTGVQAHRAAYEFAHGPIPAGLYVLHNCDNRKCQNPAHLRAGTQLDNMRDMKARGREVKARGEASGMAKLTEAQVREMRSLPATRADKARRYGVTWQAVDAVMRRETWGHVK